MTSPISSIKALVLALLLAVPFTAVAQDDPVQTLISQSLARLQQQTTPESFLTSIAELQRIDAMYPDRTEPKFQLALQSLYFSVMNPHAEQTEKLLAETEQIIGKLEETGGTDPSDICTLKGFLQMVRIVQDPARNGRLYYLDVMQNYEKALSLNPENALAKQLQQQFQEGMRRAME